MTNRSMRTMMKRLSDVIERHGDTVGSKTE